MSNLKNLESIEKFKIDSPVTLEIDATQDFLGEILEELNEDVAKKDRGEESYISFHGEIEKIDGKYEEFLHITGIIKTTYYTVDIIDSSIMTDSLEQEVKCLILTNEVINKLEMQDEIDIEYNGEEYDLYFLDKENCLDLKGILHEYIFLNKNNYPKKNQEE